MPSVATSYPFPTSTSSSLQALPELHLSLSRTLYVKEMHKELLLQMLSKTKLTLPSQTRLLFSRPAKYTNDEGTCHFLALEGDEQNEEVISTHLSPIVRVIDAVLKRFGLPVYYSPPRFHVSVAWSAKDFELDEFVNTFTPIEVELNEILIKCGNKVTKLF